MITTDRDNQIYVIYDGDCPFCRSFSEKIAIEKSLGTLTLIDGKKDLTLSAKFRNSGYCLDEGNLLIVDGKIYQGADAIYLLNLISSSKGLLNQSIYRLFSSARSAALLYPIVRFIRLVSLKLNHKPTFQQAIARYRHE